MPEQLRVTNFFEEPLDAMELNNLLLKNGLVIAFLPSPMWLYKDKPKAKNKSRDKRKDNVGLLSSIVIHKNLNTDGAHPITLKVGEKGCILEIDDSASDFNDEQLKVGIEGACSVGLSVRPNITELVLSVSDGFDAKREEDEKRFDLIYGMFKVEK